MVLQNVTQNFPPAEAAAMLCDVEVSGESQHDDISERGVVTVHSQTSKWPKPYGIMGLGSLGACQDRVLMLGTVRKMHATVATSRVRRSG